MNIDRNYRSKTYVDPELNLSGVFSSRSKLVKGTIGRNKKWKTFSENSGGHQQLIEKIPDINASLQKYENSGKEILSILSNDSVYISSCTRLFEQFSKKKQGQINLNETKVLFANLFWNLQLPCLNNNCIHKIFHYYKQSESDAITLSAFQIMYFKILQYIYNRYFYNRHTTVQRKNFILKKKLMNLDYFNDIFHVKKKLGSGSFGQVFLVYDTLSKMQRVCKIIDLVNTEVPPEQIQSEIDILKTLDHPNVVKIYEVYNIQEKLYIIMEYCNGGELSQKIKETFSRHRILSEKYVADIMLQLIEGLNYIHSKRIAHKDLKPENILFHSPSCDSPIKIIDFGLAEIFERKKKFSNIAAGTCIYMAPEVMEYYVTFKSDIWSAGCIFFELLTGSVPYPGDTITAVKKKIIKDKPPFYYLDNLPVSKHVVGLLEKMLEKDLENRFTAKQCLNHPWLFHAREDTILFFDEISQSLKNFIKHTELKKILINLLSHQISIQGNQLRKMNSFFRVLDVDGNGLISMDELAIGLYNHGLQSYEINQIIESLDIDGSKSISYSEILAASYSWEMGEDLICSLFYKFDEDRDGKITISDFVDILIGYNEINFSHKGPNENRLQLKILVEEMDTNNDGYIDCNELLSYIQQN